MKLRQQQLEAHLWGAANILRGKTAGQDYKNYILSLMFYKRLCDQWENEADEALRSWNGSRGERSRKNRRQCSGRGASIAFQFPIARDGAMCSPFRRTLANFSPMP